MRYTFAVIAFIGLCVLGAPLGAAADSLEQQVAFTVNPAFDAKERDTLLASLRKITDQLYFYVEDEWWGLLTTAERQRALSHIDELALRFENEIYPGLTSRFGPEERPGIDNDLRITILIHRMKGGLEGGYVNRADFYTKFESPKSNEREMLYLGAQEISSPLAKSYLAHELTHVLYFSQKKAQRELQGDTWFEEGLAEVASTLLGYDNPGENSYSALRLEQFVRDPQNPLAEWQNLLADYGVAHVFFQYVKDQYGPEFLAELMHSHQTGIAAFNDVLAKRQRTETFHDIFTNWSIAVFLNDCSYGTQYCFSNPNFKNLRVVPRTNFLSPFGESQLTVSLQTKNWAGNWHRISGGKGELQIVFDGNPGVRFVVPYLIQGQNNGYSLGFFDLSSEQLGTLRVPEFGDKHTALVILPSIQQQTSGFENSPSSFFSWTVSTTSENDVTNTDQASLLQQIAQLQAQVQALQEELRLLRGGGENQTACSFNENLSYGTRNQNGVKCLQEFLSRQGLDVYPEGLVTGNFLSLTREAVIRFQEKHATDILAPYGLNKGTGLVGQTTRKKINELLQSQDIILTISQGGV